MQLEELPDPHLGMILSDARIVQRVRRRRLNDGVEGRPLAEQLLHRRQVFAAQPQRVLLLRRRQLQLLLRQPAQGWLSRVVSGSGQGLESAEACSPRRLELAVQWLPNSRLSHSHVAERTAQRVHFRRSDAAHEHCVC